MYEWTCFKEVSNLILFFDFLLSQVHTAVFIENKDNFPILTS